MILHQWPPSTIYGSCHYLNCLYYFMVYKNPVPILTKSNLYLANSHPLWWVTVIYTGCSCSYWISCPFSFAQFVPKISPSPRHCEIFHNMANFLWWGVVSTHLTLNPEDHPMSTVCDCLFKVFVATLHIGGCSSTCNLRMCNAVMAGTHLPWSLFYCN